MATLTDAELEGRFPWMPWRAPMLLEVVDTGRVVFLCRYCCARELEARVLRHLGGEDAEFVSSGMLGGHFFWSSSEHQEHLDREHSARAA